MPLIIDKDIKGNISVFANVSGKCIKQDISANVTKEEARRILAIIGHPLGEETFLLPGFLFLVNQYDPEAPLALKINYETDSLKCQSMLSRLKYTLVGLFQQASYDSKELNQYLYRSPQCCSAIPRDGIQKIICCAEDDACEKGVSARRKFSTILEKDASEVFGLKPLLEESSCPISSLSNPILIARDHSSVLTESKFISLHRSQELAVTYLKNGVCGGILAPSHVIVGVTDASTGKDNFLTIPNGEWFREWVNWRIHYHGNDRNEKLTYHVVGFLTSSPQGEALDSILSTRRMRPEELLWLSQGLLNVLEQNATRGFVHGDISDATIFLNAQSGGIELIYTEGLAKISKHPKRVEKTLFSCKSKKSSTYTHPILWENQKAGFEQDLFSAGITILYATLCHVGGVPELLLFESLKQKPEQKDYYEEKKNIMECAQKAFRAIKSDCRDANIILTASIGLHCVKKSFDLLTLTGNLPLVSRREHVDEIQKIKGMNIPRSSAPLPSSHEARQGDSAPPGLPATEGALAGIVSLKHKMQSEQHDQQRECGEKWIKRRKID